MVSKGTLDSKLTILVLLAISTILRLSIVYSFPSFLPADTCPVIQLSNLLVRNVLEIPATSNPLKLFQRQLENEPEGLDEEAEEIVEENEESGEREDYEEEGIYEDDEEDEEGEEIIELDEKLGEYKELGEGEEICELDEELREGEEIYELDEELGKEGEERDIIEGKENFNESINSIDDELDKLYDNFRGHWHGRGHMQPNRYHGRCPSRAGRYFVNPINDCGREKRIPYPNYYKRDEL
ncbi:hypothetical protein G9A89_001837 [Geosiphon pyriformis]|nr:hypothetical protein G9A89_001837 [Geosiphon pyriformis]